VKVLASTDTRVHGIGDRPRLARVIRMGRARGEVLSLAHPRSPSLTLSLPISLPRSLHHSRMIFRTPHSRSLLPRTSTSSYPPQFPLSQLHSPLSLTHFHSLSLGPSPVRGMGCEVRGEGELEVG
jgi:hypothetical protein